MVQVYGKQEMFGVRMGSTKHTYPRKTEVLTQKRWLRDFNSGINLNNSNITMETKISHMLSKLVPHNRYMGRFSSYGNKIGKRIYMGIFYLRMFPYV